jgi:hypothetical protein
MLTNWIIATTKSTISGNVTAVSTTAMPDLSRGARRQFLLDCVPAIDPSPCANNAGHFVFHLPLSFKSWTNPTVKKFRLRLDRVRRIVGCFCLHYLQYRSVGDDYLD